MRFKVIFLERTADLDTLLFYGSFVDDNFISPNNSNYL